MTKKKIPQKAEEINLDNAEIETQEVPYFQVPNSAVDEEGNLSAYELLVYFVLCRYGNRGKAAFPSYNTIARKAAISRASAARALTGLLKKGYITKQTRAGSSNVYKVLFEPVSQGDGVVSQGDGLPVSERDPRKNNLSSKKKERGTLSIDTQTALKHYQEMKPDQVVNKTDIETLTTLIKQHGLDTITEALTLHVKEPDEWTAKRGSSLATFNHNLPAYLEKVKRNQEEAEKRAREEAAEKRRQEKYRQEEEAARQEEARRESLTPQQRRLEDIARRQQHLKTMLDIWQDQADSGNQEAAAKVNSYQVELADLEKEQAELTTAKEA